MTSGGMLLMKCDPRMDLWGGTAGSFTGLDRFNRMIDQKWTANGSTDVDQFAYGYDRSSNRTFRQSSVLTALLGGRDWLFGYDALDRMTTSDRGLLNASGTGLVSGTKTYAQAFGLGATGNFNTFKEDTTGSGTSGSGAWNLEQTRDHTPANAIDDIQTSTGPNWITPQHDPAGNMVTLPEGEDPTEPMMGTYDAWNRLVKAESTGLGVLGSYAFDGLGRRIKKTASGKTRHFYYSAGFQNLEERLEGESEPERQHVWGLAYVDELVLRDRATTTETTDGGTLDERLYPVQDAMFNVSAIVDGDSGEVAERYDYLPYGSREVVPVTPPTPPSTSSSVSSTTSTSETSSTAFSSSSTSESTETASSTEPSTEEHDQSAYDWTLGHQGLMLDTETGLIYNRARMLHPTLGRFQRRDPKGYVDGLNLYQAVGGNPVNTLDPMGTDSEDERGWVWPWNERASRNPLRTAALWRRGAQRTATRAARWGFDTAQEQAIATAAITFEGARRTDQLAGQVGTFVLTGTQLDAETTSGVTVWWDWLKGVGQGTLNAVQGLQNIAVDVHNVSTYVRASSWIQRLSGRDPTIESWDWTEGRLVDEDPFLRQASIVLGSEGAFNLRLFRTYRGCKSSPPQWK